MPQPEDNKSWIENEFAQTKLKDPRQIRRVKTIAEDLMRQPQASINAASGSWAAAKAAYRFFASPIEADDLLSGHRQSTIQRMRERPVVLAVQDTTTLNFTTQRAKQGLGSIGTNKSDNKGFYCHTTLAIDPKAGALGVLDMQSYLRKEQPLKRGRTAEATQRESVRWLKSLACCQQAAQSCGPATQIISVADREADFYEFFAYAKKEAPQVELLVRAQYDRELEEGRLFAQIREQPRLGTTEIEVPRSPGQASRTACLQIRAKVIRLKAPAHWRNAEQWPELELWAIEAWEADAPETELAICWRLLTTLPVEGFAEALEKITYYCLRWTIEVWHKILKSGCKFEARQLESFPRLERVLRLDAIIAWRVLYLIGQGRAHPQLDCTAVLETYEWKALYGFLKKAPPPNGQPPSLGEALLLVARLGGFLARKSDGHPGPQVLWRGLSKLDNIAQAWLVFSSPETCG